MMDFNDKELVLLRDALWAAWDWCPNKEKAEEYLTLHDKINNCIKNENEDFDMDFQRLTFSMADILKEVK